MNKWSGFFIGLAIALIGVMTLVRPSDPAARHTLPSVVVTQPADIIGHVEAAQPAMPAITEAAEQGAAQATPREPSDVAAHSASLPATVAQDPQETAVASESGEDMPLAEPGDPSPATGGLEPVPAEVLVQEPPVEAGASPELPIDPMAVQTATVVGEGGGTRQWYAFWQPFTSELSARGFRARLEQVTGLDYRVVRVDSGEYHVAFGYDDEPGRMRNLAAIESATGLKLGGESF